ncbi:MAG TPA: carboxymuconolactone decarboxylase family protein [Candidatus Cloacimonetes bacterium]|nr:carboxymuconolactone decarboxylase family protein [Candidatus Cloacimonadota bacterium]HHE39943.1 carboxymuconolactone decarboxylase family protein [Candidatus Cloacimonadota bacterium]
MSDIEDFEKERDESNKKVLDFSGKIVKRYFNLDFNTYQDGALSKKTKELLGLVSSFVLRCDDCISYHLIECKKQGVTDEELDEALSVGLVVGGTIAIPHLRRAIKTWLELKDNEG